MKSSENYLETEVPEEEVNFGLKDSFIEEIAELLKLDDLERIYDLCYDLPAAEMVELIMKLNRSDRIKLVESLEEIIEPEVFSNLESNVLNDLLDNMAPAYIAAIINELESDDALHILSDMDDEKRQDVILNLDRKLRTDIEEGFTYPEDSAGRIMQKTMVVIPQFWTIGKTVDYLRAAANNLPEKFYDVFIIDPRYKLSGVISLNKMLISPKLAKLEDLMDKECVTVPADADQQDVANLFRKRDLLSAAVVDEEERIIGMITIDDIVDVIHEEAEKDLLQLSGVNDEGLHLKVLSTARVRFVWLLVNLFTAVIASEVIGIFEGSIAKLAILAVLMPIVASMGGNAGTQTLAVTVRALAANELSSVNTWRTILSECAVGVINGVLFAIISGIYVYFWAHSLGIAVVMAAAMIINLFAAALSGVVIPIVMEKMGSDPAQSSVVFLTTVTDVVGFFSFLGLATMFLLSGQ